MSTIILTGATGKVSGAAIAALKGSEHKLVALVRNIEKAQTLKALGAELRVGDLARLRSLKGTFDGVDTSWLLVPPEPLAPMMQSNALWAAREAGVKHVVRMSAVGAAHDAPTLNSRMHALSDSELIHSGIAYTILKPHFFMQNLMYAAQTVIEQGTIYMAFGEGRLPMIDVRDIGAAAAKVLSRPDKHAEKVYTLTGADAITMHQVTSAIGEAVGKPVKYVPIPVESAVEMMVKMGMDDYGQTAMGDYYTAYSKNWQSEPTGEFKRITGKEPRSISEFARDFAGAFGKKQISTSAA